MPDLTSSPMPEPGSDTAIARDERKSWLDYLRSLNDRQAQAAQRSGLTSYVLLAVVAGLLYRYVPRLPDLLSNRKVVLEAAAIFALQFDTLIMLSVTHYFLLAYCGLKQEHRVLPEAKGRASGIGTLLLVVILACLGALQLWLGIRLKDVVASVRIALLGYGGLWLVLIILTLGREIATYRRVTAHKIPYRRFTTKGLKPTHNLWAMVICGGIAFVGAFALLRYLNVMNGLWVTPLGAASITLTILVILNALFIRGLNRLEQSTYEALERDILLDKIQPDEIRLRFIRDSLGSDARDWLDGV